MQANVLESVVSTIVAAQYPTASSDQRNAAAHALTQVHPTLLFAFALSRVILPCFTVCRCMLYVCWAHCSVASKQ